MKLNSIYAFLSDNSYLLPLGIVALTLIMLALTLLPADALVESKIFSYDKLGHFLMFGSWTFSVGLYNYVNNSETPSSIWIFFIIGVAFGALIEILQYIMPFHRDPDFYDLLFDGLGCLCAVLLLKQMIPKREHAPQNA